MLVRKGMLESNAFPGLKLETWGQTGFRPRNYWGGAVGAGVVVVVVVLWSWGGVWTVVDSVLVFSDFLWWCLYLVLVSVVSVVWVCGGVWVVVVVDCV